MNRRGAGDAPVLYVHGVPTGSRQWHAFLARTGGVAPDLPGFGSSDKPAHFDYSIPGYGDFLEAFVDALGLERFSLVLHDWGAVGLRAGTARGPRAWSGSCCSRTVPLVPGYRWHRVARGLAPAARGRAGDGVHDEEGPARPAAAGARRPRVGALRPRHPASDPEALSLRSTRRCSRGRARVSTGCVPGARALADRGPVHRTGVRRRHRPRAGRSGGARDGGVRALDVGRPARAGGPRHGLPARPLG